MGSVSAIRLDFNRSRVVSNSRSLKKLSTKKAKVISLKKHADKARVANKTQSSKKARLSKLTPAIQEQMILDYRAKGRTLAHSILRRWHSRIDPQEVESVVDLSLCEAVRRFDPSIGASFITFLFYHLRGNLIRAVSVAAATNHISLPDFDALDSHCEQYNRGRQVNAMEIAETLCNHDYESPDEALMKKEVAEISSRACDKLDPLEREIILRICVKEQQLLEIAEELGYSRCHISRVKRKALETLGRELGSVLELEPKIDCEEEEDSKAKSIQRRPRSRRARACFRDESYMPIAANGSR